MLGSQLNTAFGTQGALAILGDLSTATAAGTTQATATLLTNSSSIVTAGSGGVRLPVTPTVSAKDRLHVANHLATTLSVYPPTGGKFGTALANVPALVAPGKCADFLCIDGTNYTALLSA